MYKRQLQTGVGLPFGIWLLLINTDFVVVEFAYQNEVMHSLPLFRKLTSGLSIEFLLLLRTAKEREVPFALDNVLYLVPAVRLNGRSALNRSLHFGNATVHALLGISSWWPILASQ